LGDVVFITKIPIGRIKTCTIIRDIDRWFACFSCDNNVEKSSSNNAVGVNIGLLNWITLSNGEIIDRPRFLKDTIDRISLQRDLSRKKKHSRNWEKARIKLPKKGKTTEGKLLPQSYYQSG
jgi:putative transposase